VADQSAASCVKEVVAGFPGVHVISTQKGLSRGRNACLDALEGSADDIILFPNDNTWYLRHTLLNIDERMMSSDVDVLVGRLTYGDGSSPFPVPAGRTTLVRDTVLLASSTTMAVRSRWFTDGLRFDERLGSGSPTPYQAGEESDLLLKILQQGGRAELHADLIVCGDDSTASLPLWRQVRKTWGYGRGNTYVLRAHHLSRRMLALSLARPLVRAALSVALLDFRQAMVALARFAGRLRGLLPG
jgi:hypothetical protein